jgi:hypothetical protein
MELDRRLVEKGKHEPREGLAQQGKVHCELAKKYATELAGNGWSAEDTVAFEAEVTALDSSIADQADAKIGARSAASAEKEGLDGAKRFILRLRNALPRALREAQIPGLTTAAFKAGETLGRSTPRISAYLAKIRPAVEKIDSHLAKHFDGKMGTEVLDAVKSALDSAGAAQELTWKGLPLETLVVYETKGRVLERIEDMNRAGRSAFVGQPEVLALFNKELIERARKSRPKKAEAPKKAAESSTEAPKAGEPAAKDAP